MLLKSGGTVVEGLMCLCGVCGCIVYHALFLEELTVLELMEKIAALFSMPFRQLRHIYKQGPTGIHVLVTDEVRASGIHCSKIAFFSKGSLTLYD